jgi:hypothetical protein
LVAERGVIAMFLRPLTIKRGGDQVVRRQLPLERTLLVLLTLTTALSSATVVALFGVRSISDLVVNPLPSFGLAALNDIYFYSNKDDAVFPPGYGTPFDTPVTGLLTSFLYRAAYIAGLKATGRYHLAGSYDIAFLPEQGQIGDKLYETLYTGGIGLNVSSYLQYSGITEEFNVPAEYSFNKFEAIVFGTHVDVTCTNVTSEYSIETAQAKVTEDFVRVTVAGKPGGPSFRLAHWAYEGPMMTPHWKSNRWLSSTAAPASQHLSSL